MNLIKKKFQKMTEFRSIFSTKKVYLGVVIDLANLLLKHSPKHNHFSNKSLA